MKIFKNFVLLSLLFPVFLCAQPESELLTSAVKQFTLREYVKSAELYTKVIDLNPKNMDAFFNRGLCFFKTDNYAKAAADFSTVIANKPNDADALNYRAQSYQWLEQNP